VTRCTRAILVGAVTFVAFGIPATAHAQAGPLQGTVGTATNPDAMSIALTHADGRPVTQLDPGTYTIVVQDFSTMHNFHLTGPGVDVSTNVEGTGVFTFTVTLSVGTYRFQCDVHPTTMNGTFRVGAAPPPPPARPPTRLNATVGPGMTISLRTSAGARVRRLAAGRYRIVVRDRSAIHSFRLAGPGVRKATGVRFRGTVTWTVTLRRGLHRFWCATHPTQMRGSFRVT
jgi:plastocyanin